MAPYAFVYEGGSVTATEPADKSEPIAGDAGASHDTTVGSNGSSDGNTNNQLTIYKSCFMNKKYPDADRTGKCVHTSGFITRTQRCDSTFDSAVKVTSILLDTGAAASFVSRALVNILGFKVDFVAPKRFEIADGTIIVHDQMVWLHLTLGGVTNWVRAYVDDSKSTSHLLLGMPAFARFRMSFNASFGTGKKNQNKITVAMDMTGARRKLFVLPMDMPDVTPWIRDLGHSERFYKRMSVGMTEREARKYNHNRRVHRDAPEKYYYPSRK